MIRLALTLGDPRGIGPEIAAKALSDPRIAALGASWHVIGPTSTPVPVHESVGVWTPTGHGVEHIALAGRLAGLAVARAAARSSASSASMRASSAAKGPPPVATNSRSAGSSASSETTTR